ncbi:hypothetical protein HDU96_003130, partial [Phlyctochytrium bullatum]
EVRGSSDGPPISSTTSALAVAAEGSSTPLTPGTLAGIGSAGVLLVLGAALVAAIFVHRRKKNSQTSIPPPAGAIGGAQVNNVNKGGPIIIAGSEIGEDAWDGHKRGSSFPDSLRNATFSAWNAAALAPSGLSLPAGDSASHGDGFLHPGRAALALKSNGEGSRKSSGSNAEIAKKGRVEGGSADLLEPDVAHRRKFISVLSRLLHPGPLMMALMLELSKTLSCHSLARMTQTPIRRALWNKYQ